MVVRFWCGVAASVPRCLGEEARSKKRDGKDSNVMIDGCRGPNFRTRIIIMGGGEVSLFLDAAA